VEFFATEPKILTPKDTDYDGVLEAVIQSQHSISRGWATTYLKVYCSGQLYAASICIETIGPRGHIIRVFKVESFIRFRSSQEDNGRTPVVPILSSVVSDKHNSKKKTISTTGQATSPCLKGALLHAAETEI
jgi:hypothetical protein